MVNDFRAFLTKSNALALAVGVIIGAATGKVVSAVVDDLLMPIIGIVMPAGDWKEMKIVLKTAIDPKTGKEVVTAIQYGHFLGTVIDFIIIALVIFLIVKAFVKPAPEAPAVPTKECPECKEAIAEAARKCKFCGSAV
ncbi:MAG: large conductance mechanosensitive channel protein MscL [Chthonomonadales bacterium]